MWIFCNPNPCHVLVGDCAIRACTIQLDSTWHKVHKDLCELSGAECNMPSANTIWGRYLEDKGRICKVPSFPITIRQFCILNPIGRYTIGTGSHAVTIIDGDWYDIWDSGDEKVAYYFEGS